MEAVYKYLDKKEQPPVDSESTVLGGSRLTHGFTESSAHPSSLVPPEDFVQVPSSSRTASARWFVPLRELNPFNNEFVVKARVLYKGSLQPREQQFLTTLIDGEGFEMPAAFTSSLFGRIAEQQVYVFSNGQV